MHGKLIIPRLKSGDRFAYYLIVLLGLICVLNLNAMSSKYLGLEQFFSPIILLLCVIGFFASGKNPIGKIGFYGRWWISGYMIYMAIGILSGVMNDRFFTALVEIINFSAAIAIAVATMLLSQRMIRGGQVDRLFKFAFWLSIASASTFYVSYFLGINAAVQEGAIRSGRFSGFFANPNELGLQTQFATAFGFCLAARTLSIKYLLITLLTCGPAVLATNSRSSMLALGFITCVLIFFVFPPKYIFRMGLAFAVVATLGLFAFNYLQDVAQGDNRYQKKRTRQMFKLLSGDVSGDTTGHRYVLALEAFNLWQKRPIIGWGLGFSNNMPISKLAPHNAILKLLVDSGLVGAAVLAIFWIIYFMNMLKAKPRWLKVGLLGMFFAISFSLVSGHTGISRRYTVFQLAVLVASFEIASQRILTSGNQGKVQYITWIRPNIGQRQPHPGGFLHQ